MTKQNDVLDVYRRADLYEASYRGRNKDYAREAEITIRVVRERAPAARRLLDVACGTGLHLQYFATAFAEVAGLDLTKEMLTLARRRVRGVPLWEGDMRKFDLGRTFDVITCMFSSVGYLADTGELDATLRSFARHLEPGGVAVIEPWWSPDTFLPGYVQGDVVKVDGRTISRVSHSVRLEERAASRMEIHWVVAEPATGISHHTEVHTMTLFSTQEYLAAFERAGFSAEYVEHELGGPGMYVGVLDRG
ncbi:class I SAM-dependent methyltransferase [Nonomuraea sp. NPDC046802]|uniref:class I SAM-dependent DNA methyltransferase n=1 Tax=Nonomuraea sp. NPDC046802 TaxID=3154919 RepID=UPI0034095238